MKGIVIKIWNTLWGEVHIDTHKFYWRKTNDLMCDKTDSHCPYPNKLCAKCGMIYSSRYDQNPFGPKVIWNRKSDPTWKEFPDIVNKIKNNMYGVVKE